jgi:hypothetical protein
LQPEDGKLRLAEGFAICADSAEPNAYAPIDGKQRKIDAVITSPPYASALPYLDTDRLSLVALHGMDRVGRRAIEEDLIGSREMTRGQLQTEEVILQTGRTGLPLSTTDFIGRYKSAIDLSESAGFRLRQAPMVISKYFRAICAVFGELADRMDPGASVFWVVGDSTSTVGSERWVIPTVAESVAIAGSRGFRLIDSIPISVTREDVLHHRNAITSNVILHFAPMSAPTVSAANG